MNRLVGVALAAVVLVAASPAWAKKRVVVLGFDGPKSASSEAAVEAIVERKYELVEASEYAAAAKRLKARKTTDKNVAKIAEDLQVDAVVTGTTKRKGNRWTLKLTVREGKTGKTLDSVTIRLSAPKVDKSAKQDITTDLLPIIASATPIIDEPPPKAKAKGKGKGKGKGKAAPVEPEEEETRTDDEVAFDPPPEEETVASVEPAPEATVDARAGDEDRDAGRRRGHDAADLLVGMSFILRDMEFTFDPALTSDQRPNAYSGQPVPGAYVAAEIYPFAFGPRRTAMSNLGFTFNLDRSLFLKSRIDLPGDGMGAITFDTTQMRWGVGARYRLPLGSGEHPPVLKAGFGYNRLSFTIDHGATDIDLPDVGYEYLDLTGGFTLPLGATLGIVGEFSYLFMLSTGEIQEQAFYGDGGVVGISLDAGLTYKLSGRLSARGGVRYARIAYDFDGTGVDASMRDGDATDQDVGGALDQYIGGYVLAGYAF